MVMYLTNILMSTISNIICFFPLYIIPNYKCGRKAFFIIFMLWGTILGNMKYFVVPNSYADIALTVINNVTFFMIIILVLKRPFYKIIIAFGLSAFISFTSQNILSLLGMEIVADIHSEQFFDMYAVLGLWDILLATGIYVVVRRIRKSEISIDVNGVMLASVLCVVYYGIFSQQYLNRQIGSKNVASVYTYWFLFVIIVLLLVRTYIVSRKKHIMEYNLAREGEREKLNRIVSQNEYIAKLRHDYINQISVIQLMAKKDPQKAMSMLEELEERYSSDNYC